MDLMIILLWFFVFAAIVIFLGTLNYFLARSTSDVLVTQKQSQSDPINQQQHQSTRSNAKNNRRKNSRNSNKKRQKLVASGLLQENSNNSSINKDKSEKNTNQDENSIQVEEEEREESFIEFSAQLANEEHDEEEEFQDSTVILEAPISSGIDSTQEEKDAILPNEQRSKDKINQTNNKSSKSNHGSSTPLSSLTQDCVALLKPQANVAPVKQIAASTYIVRNESAQLSQTNNSKSNDHLSSLHDIYSYSEHSSALSAAQQKLQEVKSFTTQNLHRQKSETQTNDLSAQFDSLTKPNDVAALTTKSKLINNKLNNNNIHFELPVQSNSHASFSSNGSSSKSDILSESAPTSPSNNNNNNNNPNFSLSTSIEYQGSYKESEKRPSLSGSNILLDKLLSIFDNVSFSTEDLELILGNLSHKQLSNRQEWRHLQSAKTKNEKVIEHILEETFHSQAKILAIELQIQKNRVLELTKTNVEMKSRIKHLQQSNDNMTPYQQTILSYQMQLRRLTEENTRSLHQLHAYSMMPNSINELKQQQQVLDERIRQITMRSSSLEKEIADGERAKKNAAEIYKKSNAQKQERIEQMINDLNKYKKIDADLSTLRSKHKELKENLQKRLGEVTDERDELEKTCSQLKERIQQYEPLKIEYEKLAQNETQSSNLEKLQHELGQLKAKNDLLKQRQVKIMDQLNKQSSRQERNQNE